MDEREPSQTVYPIPEATIAGDPRILAVVAAAILGVLVFWRKRNRAVTD